MAEIFFPGPEGRIEGRLHRQELDESPIAVVLHPHPQFGGTMHNKVAYRLFKCFAEAGFHTLRFNFRGVGKSQGVFDDGIGELSDAASALDWMQQEFPEATTCWIGGFSFGAWIAMQLLMRRPELDGFIAASPPVGMFDFSFLSPCPSSGLVTMGERDQVVKEPDVTKFMSKIQTQKHIEVDYRVFPEADHYYTEYLDELAAHVEDYLESRREEFTRRRVLFQDKKRRPAGFPE